MQVHYILVAFHALSLPAQIVAQCAACDSYNSALKSCQKADIDDTAPGQKMDTATIHCMCSTSSNAQQMEDCVNCFNQDPQSEGSHEMEIVGLVAWYDTCDAARRLNDEQAVLCWESLPDDNAPDDNSPCYYEGGTESGAAVLSATGAATQISGFAASSVPASTALPSAGVTSSVLASDGLPSSALTADKTSASAQKPSATMTTASTSSTSSSTSR